MRALAFPLCLAAACPAASAHDFWSDGARVPAWVKRWCCGESDIHRLQPGAVHIFQYGYRVDGLNAALPFSKAMPSPDGNYWAFYKDEEGPDAHVSCFYAPVNGI